MNRLSVIVGGLALLFSTGASANVYNEIGDAGQLLGTAQALPGGTTEVLGYGGNTDADLFSFFWGGGDFYANSIGTSFDSQLFLFGSSGVGIQANDDGISTAGPAYLQVASLAAGQYYLGISGYDLDPYSSAGMIFPTYPYGALYGPQNLDPLSYWSSSSGYYGPSGNWQINFQQVTSSGTPIGGPSGTAPEPATLALLGLGFAGLGFSRRKKA